ncbi:hypothetical protein VHEMI00919 [[Torrubiella] hemipterigena]|uniref:Uncharacterized protein n=1 Tax=[Torrubiella] hemipterigena TaxID=1531966 RepID=A0A0A1SKK8_9HYPO|nr:hypothetical protein VHEMI00919 [[Torrubiella] hemipterigena]
MVINQYKSPPTSIMASKDTAPEKQDSFKAQLDRAATGMNQSSYSAQGVLDRVVETVGEYVPAVSSKLKEWTATSSNAQELGKDETTPDSASSISTRSIERPLHDVQIEEFLREQHRNKNGAQLLKAAKG